MRNLGALKVAMRMMTMKELSSKNVGVALRWATGDRSVSKLSSSIT
jgi:hypothetical protein